MSHVRKIDLLTRVEGHGSVTLVKSGDRVVGARLHLNESPRLFEALLVGRRFDEVADIACRICSICSTVHKVAALQAVEQAMGITVSRQTGLLHELAVQGGQIESHALHIFFLSLPDLLGLRNVHDLAAYDLKTLQAGLAIKRCGNLIQEVVGGRAIHPFNILVGGLGAVPESDQMQRLDDDIIRIQDDVTARSAWLSTLKGILPPLPVLPVCAVSGGPPLFGAHLVTSTGETIIAREAASWLDEQIKPYSHAKVSHFGGRTPFLVGPLARTALTVPPGYADHLTGTSVDCSLKARVIELQLALERAHYLIRLLLECGLKKEVPATVGTTKGFGTSLIEAPRGVLLHSYSFNDQGICCDADIITPTAINQGAIAVVLNELVATMDGADYDQVRKCAEAAVRCFDPCISCAVH